jgi:hypothetical protein
MTTSNYLSVVGRESALWPGVIYRIEKMSFGRRIELMKTVRVATTKIDFLDAASEPDRMAAAILATEVDRIYLQWGLKEVEGLNIDGMPATPDSLIVSGPEDLLQEALAFVKSECGLTEGEKKT